MDKHEGFISLRRRQSTPLYFEDFVRLHRRLGFHPRSGLENRTTLYSIINSTTWQCYSIAIIWMVTH